MLLSIIILNYKSKNLVRECVKGILQVLDSSESSQRIDYEIIVVDNNSGDGVEAMLRTRYSGQVKFIQAGRNLGMGGGNNLGIKMAIGKYILIFQSDVVALADSIKPLIEFMEGHSQAGIVAPKIINPDGTWQSSVFKFPNLLTPFYRRTLLGKTKKGKKHLAEYVVTLSDLAQPTKVDWVLGAVFMMRKDLVDKLGGFDERFFLFFEDIDLCRRVRQAGFEVWYVTESQVVHYPHRLSAHEQGIWSLFNRNTWPHIASWLKYFWKWRGADKHGTLC